MNIKQCNEKKEKQYWTFVTWVFDVAMQNGWILYN